MYKEEIFDCKSLADFLKVEPKTVEYLARMRRIPLFFAGRHIRFLRESILEWAKLSEFNPQKVVGKLQESEIPRARKSRDLPIKQGVAL